MTCKFVTLQNITLKIYDYFCREQKRGRLYHKVSNPLNRIKSIMQIKDTTMKRWIAERDPKNVKSRSKVGRKEKTDDFDKDIIKREVIKMFKTQDMVTIRKLKVRLEERGLHLSKSTIWKVVRSKGFSFQTLDGCREAILEQPHLVAMRGRYLRKLREKRDEGLDIVYLDESYVNANHTAKKEWCSTDGKHRRKVPIGKGERIIIANAGSSQQGMIGDGEAGIVYRSISTDNRDYHSEMNGEIFKHWMENDLLPALDRPSCLVMDNASYHNVVDQEDKHPTAASRKAVIAAWLEHRGIVFDQNSTKKVLLKLANQAKEPKIFSIDKVINQHGHEALRLPAYHCQLNPIENIWSKVKGQVAANNKTFKIADTKRLTIEAIKDVNKEYFERCEQHSIKIEQNYWKKDGLIHIQPSMTINLEENDSD